MGKKNIPSLYDLHNNEEEIEEDIDAIEEDIETDEDVNIGEEPDFSNEEILKVDGRMITSETSEVVVKEYIKDDSEDVLEEDTKDEIIDDSEDVGAPDTAYQDETSVLEKDEIKDTIDEIFDQAGKVTQALKESKESYEKVEFHERKLVVEEQKQSGGVNMSRNENNGRRKVTFEGMRPQKGISVKSLEKFDNKSFEAAVKEETGKGLSTLTGVIEVHVPRKEIENAIVTMIDIAVEEAAKIGIDVKAYAEEFINCIQGLSVIVLADDAGKQTIQNFVTQICDTLIDAGASKDEAESKAISIGTSYIGKQVVELKSSAASWPAEVLTLVVDKSCIPDEEDAALSIICKGWINEVRSFTTDQQHVRIAIATDKIFGIAQSSFTAEELEDKKNKLDSVTFRPVNNILYEIIYIINKTN